MASPASSRGLGFRFRDGLVIRAIFVVCAAPVVPCRLLTYSAAATCAESGPINQSGASEGEATTEHISVGPQTGQ